MRRGPLIAPCLLAIALASAPTATETPSYEESVEIVAAPLPYEESVEVVAAPIWSVAKQFVVLGPDGTALPDVDASWLSFSIDGQPLRDDVEVTRFRGPVALTIMLDASGSMLAARKEQVALAIELLTRLRKGDHVRLLSFADDTRLTRWAEAEILLAELVRLHLRSLQRAPRRIPLSGCLATGQPDRKDASDDALRAWLSDCDLTERLALERSAVEDFLRRLMQPAGGTVPGPAMDDAVRGMLPGSTRDFLPGFDTTLGLVVMSDGGFEHALSPWTEAVLDTLLVQRWYLAGPGGRVGARERKGAAYGALEPGTAPRRAEAILAALSSVHVVHAEAATSRLLARGALRATCVLPDGGEARVVMPLESMPSADTLRAALASATDRTNREILRSMEARGIVAASVLQRLREELAAEATVEELPPSR